MARTDDFAIFLTLRYADAVLRCCDYVLRFERCCCFRYAAVHARYYAFPLMLQESRVDVVISTAIRCLAAVSAMLSFMFSTPWPCLVTALPSAAADRRLSPADHFATFFVRRCSLLLSFFIMPDVAFAADARHFAAADGMTLFSKALQAIDAPVPATTAANDNHDAVIAAVAAAIQRIRLFSRKEACRCCSRLCARASRWEGDRSYSGR